MAVETVAAPAPVVAAASTAAAPTGTVTAPAVTPPTTPVTATTAPAATLLDGIKPPEPVAKEPVKAEPPKAADYSKLEVPKDSLLPATHKEKIAAFAVKHSLSPEVAQEVMTQQSADLKAYVDTQMKAYEDVKKGWADALKAHPKFGGERLAEYNKGATEVLNKYGSPELMKSLQESGFAYRVEVAQFLDGIYQAMKSDKMVAPGAKVGTADRDMSPDAVAKRMFPKSNHV